MTKMTFHIFVNFLKTFSHWDISFDIDNGEQLDSDESVISQTLAGI